MDRVGVVVRVLVNCHMRASGPATRFANRPKGLGHDLADGSRATSALRAAPQAPVDLTRRAGTVLVVRLAGAADVMVRQDIAGTNDHRCRDIRVGLGRSDIETGQCWQKKNSVFLAIPI